MDNERRLFRFSAKTPACVPLFQLPPRKGNYGPFPNFIHKAALTHAGYSRLMHGLYFLPCGMEANPFIPRHWLIPRKAWVSGFEGRAARKPTFHSESERRLFRFSAKTPACVVVLHLPPRKGNYGLLPNIAYNGFHPCGLLAVSAIIVFSAIRHGSRPLYPSVLAHAP